MGTVSVSTVRAWVVFLLAFSFAVVGWSWAQEGICVFPTGTEEVTYPLHWAGSALTVYASDDKVSRGTSVQVWVESNGHGCPPYHWQVTGRGFHFDSLIGPTTSITNGDGEVLHVWTDNTACGSAFITIMDGCEGSAEASVREPNSGRWVLVEEISCGTVDQKPASGNCQSLYYCTAGAYRYLDAYVAGTTMNIRWHPIGNCTKYPCTPYDRNYCYDPGYSRPFYHVGIYYKKMWRWDCP